MDDDTRALLEEILALEKENNKMLRKARNHARWSALFSFIYWAILIGSSAAAFYYIQPVLAQLLQSYKALAETAKKAGSAFPGIDQKSLDNLNSILKNLGPNGQ